MKLCKSANKGFSLNLKEKKKTLDNRKQQAPLSLSTPQNIKQHFNTKNRCVGFLYVKCVGDSQLSDSNNS